MKQFEEDTRKQLEIYGKLLDGREILLYCVIINTL